MKTYVQPYQWESSRRDLLNDMAEHIPILKNNKNTYHPRFGSLLKQVQHSPNRVFFWREHSQPQETKP